MAARNRHLAPALCALGHAAFFFCAAARAEIPASYYASADATNAATLRSTLNDIVTAGHTPILFDDPMAVPGSFPSFQALRIANQQAGRTDWVRTIYGDDRPILPHDPTGDGNPATGGWNREHGYPQSFYNSEEPMVGDLHALFPADANLNGTRSDKAYDFASGAPDVFGNRTQTGLFEPFDGHKGDAARAVLYMDIRYEGESGEPNLTIAETLPGTPAGQFTMARLSTLLAWHNSDPPDLYEAWHNQRVYDLQGNANPFIDHPEWVQIVYASAAAPVAGGDGLSVGGVNRAPAFIEQDAYDIPMLTLGLTLGGAGEFDVGSIDCALVGTLAPEAVETVRAYLDADGSGTVTQGDQLFDAQTPAGGTATLGRFVPLRVTSAASVLLTLSLKPQVPLGATVGLRVEADGIAHSPRGGADVDPVFAAIQSNISAVVGGGINIVMVSTRASDSTAGNEYLVLANHSANAANVEGMQLRSRSGAGGESRLLVTLAPATALIPALGHYIIASGYAIGNVEGVPGHQSAANIFGGLGDSSGRAIALWSRAKGPGGEETNARKIDGFSWANGPAAPLDLSEGAPFAGAISSTTTARRQVYARSRAGGIAAAMGPYADTEDNAADLEIYEFSTTTGTPKPPPSDNRTGSSSGVTVRWD